jgi:hypothetical protein
MRKPSALLIRLLLAAFCAGALHAQTAGELDGILESAVLSNAQAARFVLAAADVLPADVSADEAFAYARNNKWLPPQAEGGGAINLGRLSHLLMRAFRLRGGFLYALFPGPRYGYRALIRRDIIQGFADPALGVSGERFLHILGRVLDYTAGAQAGAEGANAGGGNI